MKAKLTPKTALLVVLLYLPASIGMAVFTRIFFGGGVGRSAADKRQIDGLIGSNMYAIVAISVVLLFVSFYVFRDSSRDIFFERKPFSLSKWYYLFPLAWVAAAAGALVQVDFAAYSANEVFQLILLTIGIGINEEIVTRGILLVGMRNGGLVEWKAWVVTLVVFSLLHVVNLIGGGSFMVLFIVLTGGTLLYVTRRVFNTLWVAIGFHAFYDTAFYLFTGHYLVSADLPDKVLDYQLAIFLFLLLVSILFIVFGRKLFKTESVGWS